jgi:uncharacterized membrane protein YtjA (UPF0391 family)
MPDARLECRHDRCCNRISAAPCGTTGGKPMFRWAIIFFIIAIVAALFGFGGVAGLSADIGKFLFVAFLIVAAVTLIMGLGARRNV